MPPNFSAVYALAFCAGVYFPLGIGAGVSVVVLLATDVLINVFAYGVQPFDWLMVLNYVAYAAIFLLGRAFSPNLRAAWLVSGGMLGALLFYLVTNTGAWLHNPRYAKSFIGWFQALSVGLPEFPHTWEFFRHTMISGGMFTALFVGAVKLRGPSRQEAEESAGEIEGTEPEGTGAEAS